MTPESALHAPETGSPPWAQPGITAVADARALIDTLRSRDTLVLNSADGDIGYPLTPQTLRSRGQGATIGASIAAASPPCSDLAEYHRGLGLGPERLYCPRVLSPGIPLARLILDDTDLLGRIRSDRVLRRMVIAFKDRTAELLLERLGLFPAYCSPSASAYEVANDKLAFTRAGPRYGFETLSMRTATDAQALDSAFRELSELYGDGCILRLPRGAGGSHMCHARSLRAARRGWERLRRLGQVLVTPYVPPGLVLRQVSTHGIVTPRGFCPLVFTDQLVRKYRYRGGRVTYDWAPEEVAAVSSSLQAVASWLRDLGYVGAPAGVDGFLIRCGKGLRFLVLDPNIRMTATMMPWAVAVTLSEAAGRRFVWQVESFVIAGRAITLRWLQQRLGTGLINAARLEQGGILPSTIARPRTSPLGVSRLRAILFAQDADHLAHLRDQVRWLGLLVR